MTRIYGTRIPISCSSKGESDFGTNGFQNNESMLTRVNESEISGEVAKMLTILTTSKAGVTVIPLAFRYYSRLITKSV